MRLQSVQCLREGGQYLAQAETELCSPAQLWSGVAKNTQKHQNEQKTQFEFIILILFYTQI